MRGGLAQLLAVTPLLAGKPGQAAVASAVGGMTAASSTAGFVYVPIEDANRIVELDTAGWMIWQALIRDSDDGHGRVLMVDRGAGCCGAAAITNSALASLA